MNKNPILIGIVSLLIGIGIGYGGANALHPATPAPNARGTFAGGMRGGAGGFLSGTVAAKDSESITLDTRDGSSHVVLLTPATSVLKSVSGTENDISIGSTVIVSGTTNGDGSVSANLIQLRPATPPAPGQ
ncbi:MAG: hypothetical protein KGH56_00390 [Patescibacteria group bacterium]|nr:hypothetical protein [Patescibacteria group bacterium]